MRTHPQHGFLCFAALALVLCSFGCKASDGEETPEEGGSSGKSGNESGKGGGGNAGNDGTSGTGGHEIPDGGVLGDGGFFLDGSFIPFEDAGGGTGGNGPGEPCEGQNGNHEGAKTKPLHFLNQCTDSQCEPFDNVDRLPLYEKGKPLPALPTP